MIGEPAPTQADIHFQLFGIPVRIHPFFWVVAVLLGFNATDRDPVYLLIWVVAVFVSILIHELGHALTAKYVGEDPWITLYSFGGLASYRPTRHDSRTKILISAAGPAAGFLFIAFVMALVYGVGQRVGLGTRMPWVQFEFFDNDRINELIFYLIYINIFWGLVNLLPIYPLDGGQISRELFVRFDLSDGVRKSLYISMACAVGMALFGALMLQSIFIAIMFGFMAFMNYQLLQQMQGGGGFGGGGFGGGFGGGDRYGGGRGW